MLQNCGQHDTQVFRCFDVVMQYNNRSWSRISKYIIATFLGCNVGIKVATQNIPHNQSVLSAEFFALASTQAAVRWSKQFALNPVGTFLHIFEVGFVGRFPSIQVIVGMIAYSMSILKNLPVNFRMFAHVIANAEKSSFGFVASQDFQYPGRKFWYGAIVESEV